MKKIDKETLKIAADKLLFDMSEEEYNTLLSEFETIIHQMSLIGNIKGLDELEPMTFPYDVSTSFLREDVATTPTDRDELLKNASDVVDGQIRLPKVVG